MQDYDLPALELYPKQDILVTGPGSFVRLPFGRHLMTGRRYHFIDPKGNSLAPTIREQIHLLASPQRVPEEFVAETLARAPEPTVLIPTPNFQPRGNAEGQTLSERLKNSITVYDFVSQYVELRTGWKWVCGTVSLP